MLKAWSRGTQKSMKSVRTEFSRERVQVSGEQILNGVLLSTIDPAGENQEQQLSRMQLRFHIPPDARLRPGASEIFGNVSSVGSRAVSARARQAVTAVCSSAEYFYPTGFRGPLISCSIFGMQFFIEILPVLRRNSIYWYQLN